MSSDALNETTAEPLVAIKLLKNYRPLTDEFEVVGYESEPVLRKNAAGVMVEVEPGRFNPGELPPPAQPGTGFKDKIWAGAVIKLPREEAKRARKLGIGEYELAD